MANRSDRVASWLAGLGVGRGDRVMLMLGNQLELWDCQLAVIKLGAVIMPTAIAAGAADLADRVERGGATVVVTTPEQTAKFADVPGAYARVCTARADGWADLREAFASDAPPMRIRAPRPRTHSALLHVRDDVAPQARRAHPGLLSGGTPCRRCTSSACVPATSTSTPPAPAAPSTRGPASSPRGSPRRRSSSSPIRASTPTGCCGCCATTRCRPSAHLRRSGGCSSRRPLRRAREPARERRRR
jgi:hypothetical protein